MRLDQLTPYPFLLNLFDLWNQRRGERLMPLASELYFGPDLAGFLPSISIFDVEAGATRFRYHFVGRVLSERFGSDSTGLVLEDVMSGDYLETIGGIFRDLCRDRTPYFVETMLVSPERSWRYNQRVLLPLANRDGDVAQIVTGQVYLDENPLTRQPVLEHPQDFTHRAQALTLT